MNYLLDTHILLWSLEGNLKKLSPFLKVLENEQNHIAVSVVSYWEIAIKKSLNKLTIPPNFIEIVQETGFSWLNLTLPHITELEKLPPIHQDPFDRLLIAQARSEKLKLLTVDEKVLQYPLI